ncbi:FHA domain-containing protein [bacterium]|nr:FHA domain-containing protein [bacterium]
MFSCGLQIRVSQGPDKGRTFPLDSAEITIGRARTPGDRAPGWVLLNDPQTSRIHADLQWNYEARQYMLIHRSDTNPTEVNGVPVQEAVTLKIGDHIRLGSTVLDIQQADFRFGGVAPENIAAIHEARRTGNTVINHELAFRDPVREGEARGNTKTAGRKIALSTRPKLSLEILGGKQQGTKLPMTGFQIQVGGNQVEDVADGPQWWDQDLALNEAALPYRCMAWKWRELDKAFEVRLIRNLTMPITLERRVDGTEWIGEMPPNAVVTVRPYDLLYIGNTALQLVVDR